jgi:hypothetical protein
MVYTKRGDRYLPVNLRFPDIDFLIWRPAPLWHAKKTRRRMRGQAGIPDNSRY